VRSDSTLAAAAMRKTIGAKAIQSAPKMHTRQGAVPMSATARGYSNAVPGHDAHRDAEECAKAYAIVIALQYWIGSEMSVPVANRKKAAVN
jgi:hypothetical protein